MKKIIVTITMIAILTGSIFAQSLPGEGFTSPQNTSTQGRIRSNADDFIRPDAFQNLNFEKWFGMASFQSNLKATIGYATRFGTAKENEDGTTGKKPIFLGLFYGGSAWANYQSIPTTERNGKITFTTYDSISEDLNASDSTVQPFVLDTTLPYNQAAILIGLPKMGLRLSFHTTYKGISQKDFLHINNVSFIDTNNDTNVKTDEAVETNYKSYKAGLGVNSPQLAWSMSNNLTKVGIRPWVTFDLEFNRNYRKNQIYDGNTAGDWTINNSVNYIQPILQFGLGGITIVNKNGWRSSFDLEYRMRVRIYDNEFDYTPAGGGYKQIAKIKGRNTNGTLDEYSWQDHRIRPSLSTQWNGDKFRFRLKFDLNMELQSTESTRKVRDSSDNSKLVSNGAETNEFIFRLNPDLALAAQWQISEKFFLNMGGRINIGALVLTNTKGAVYTNGSKNDNSDYKTSAETFGLVANNLTLGLTINATNNFFIEGTAGVGTDNMVNFFSTAKTSSTATDRGLFVFGGILLGLRF